MDGWNLLLFSFWDGNFSGAMLHFRWVQPMHCQLPVRLCDQEQRGSTPPLHSGKLSRGVDEKLGSQLIAPSYLVQSLTWIFLSIHASLSEISWKLVASATSCFLASWIFQNSQWMPNQWRLDHHPNYSLEHVFPNQASIILNQDSSPASRQELQPQAVCQEKSAAHWLDIPKRLRSLPTRRPSIRVWLHESTWFFSPFPTDTSGSQLSQWPSDQLKLAYLTNSQIASSAVQVYRDLIGGWVLQKWSTLFPEVLVLVCWEMLRVCAGLSEFSAFHPWNKHIKSWRIVRKVSFPPGRKAGPPDSL